MARPPVFAELSFEAALEHAHAEGKLLIVDATAAWCGPGRTDEANAVVVEARRRDPSPEMAAAITTATTCS